MSNKYFICMKIHNKHNRSKKLTEIIIIFIAIELSCNVTTFGTQENRWQKARRLMSRGFGTGSLSARH